MLFLFSDGINKCIQKVLKVSLCCFMTEQPVVEEVLKILKVSVQLLQVKVLHSKSVLKLKYCQKLYLITVLE